MPLTRDDTIFLFAPATFLQNLASPHYRVELDRRLRSVGEMRAIKLAHLAAAAEGQPANSIDDLIAAELLPAGFGQRFDGSKLDERIASVTYRDSLRGEAGWMTPIPDMPVDRITPPKPAAWLISNKTCNPPSAALRRSVSRSSEAESPAQKGWDRITADVRVARYSQMPVAKWPAMLGEAQSNRVAPIAGDAVSLEIVLGALGDPVHLFGGIRDFNTPARRPPGRSANQHLDHRRHSRVRRRLAAATTARPIPGPPDPARLMPTASPAPGIGGLFDLWFRRADDFFLFSFKRDVLLEVGRQLAMIEAERPAQIRLHIDDLTNKQIATTVNGFGYMRSRDTSASASRFMNSLTTQLHVKPEDARPLGEDLVAGKFVCPLGGKYVLVDPFSRAAERSADPAEQLPPPPETPGEPASATDAPTARKLWVSTAPPPENRFLLTVIPANYQMPLMNWFRGLTADVARVNDELWLNAQLDMTHIEVGPPEDPEGAGGGLNLPNLGSLFSGFGAKKDEAVKPASANEESTIPIKK